MSGTPDPADGTETSGATGARDGRDAPGARGAAGAPDAPDGLGAARADHADHAADGIDAPDGAGLTGGVDGASRNGKAGRTGGKGGSVWARWPRRGRWSPNGARRTGAARGTASGSWTTGGKKGRPDLPGAALTIATEWGWPVLPGIGLQQRTVGLQPRGGARCACPDPECTVPGAHPFDPGLLAATTDERMVRWWWANRPTAPIIMATGGRAPCAVSLPAVAAARALAALDSREMRIGPVLATPTRWSILVAPYSMEQLGDLLYAKDFVPGSLRFHGEGGYLALPPSRTGQGRVRWERAPLPGSAAPWVPDVEAVVDAVVDALTHRGVSAPEM